MFSPNFELYKDRANRNVGFRLLVSVISFLALFYSTTIAVTYLGRLDAAQVAF